MLRLLVFIVVPLLFLLGVGFALYSALSGVGIF